MLNDLQIRRLRQAGADTAEAFRMAGEEPDPDYDFSGEEDRRTIMAIPVNWPDPEVARRAWAAVRSGYLDDIDGGGML